MDTAKEGQGSGGREAEAIALDEEQIDALAKLVARPAARVPAHVSRSLVAAGLVVAAESGRLEPTERAREALLAACMRRREHAENLEYGGVSVTGGPHRGEAGYYDDDSSGEESACGALAGYDPGARAIVYLFSRGGPILSEPVEVPHHHLVNEAHLDLEQWVQENPVAAASLGIPSPSGIERYVSEERVLEAQERVQDSLLADFVPDSWRGDGDPDDDVPF